MRLTLRLHCFIKEKTPNICVHSKCHFLRSLKFLKLVMAAMFHRLSNYVSLFASCLLSLFRGTRGPLEVSVPRVHRCVFSRLAYLVLYVQECFDHFVPGFNCITSPPPPPPIRDLQVWMDRLDLQDREATKWVVQTELNESLHRGLLQKVQPCVCRRATLDWRACRDRKEIL